MGATLSAETEITVYNGEKGLYNRNNREIITDARRFIMYQFRPVTERIRQMRELIRDRVVRFDSERAMILTEAYKKYAQIKFYFPCEVFHDSSYSYLKINSSCLHEQNQVHLRVSD